MELTLRITNEADMSRFASLLSNIFPAGRTGETIDVTVAAPDPAPAPTARRSKTTPASAPVAQQKQETNEIDETPVAQASTTEAREIAPEEMRKVATAKIQEDKDNGAKIKAIVGSLGVSAISAVPADRRAEFIDLVSAL